MKQASLILIIAIILSSCTDIDKNHTKVSMIELLSKDDDMVGRKVDVYGYLSDNPDSFYTLYFTENFSEQSVLENSISIFSSNTNLRKHIEERCMGRYVRILGTIKSDLRHSFFLEIDGVVELIEVTPESCHFGYFVEDPLIKSLME